jgi:hypothetical protein
MNITTYGFEKEFFIKDPKTDQFVLAPRDLAMDECGFLAEARGEPHSNPLSARHLLAANIETLKKEAGKKGVILVDSHSEALPRELIRLALRSYGKPRCKAYFAHGRAYRSDRPRAGLHIHFGNKRLLKAATEDRSPIYTHDPLNIPRIIWLMDEAFSTEIKEARRVPGEYEMKEWGFEYRSLPSTVNLDKVVTVLEQIADD